MLAPEPGLPNTIGLALAASGHLRPVLAAVLMAGSSVLVVLNSLRLERFAEPTDDRRPVGASLGATRAAATHQATSFSAPTGDLAVNSEKVVHPG
jgi:P-type Cu2+ transporter